MLKISTHSSRETETLGRELGKRLRGGEALSLIGDLGSGKTTFVRGLARGLGIRSKIKSPSFVILQEYPRSKRGLKLFHLDLYRVRHAAEAYELGLAEILKGKRNVVAIEWPKLAKKILPRNAATLKFAHGRTPHTRIIKIS